MHEGIGLLREAVNEGPIAHVPFHEVNLLGVQQIPEVLQIPGISQLLEDDDLVPLVHGPPREVRADESGSTRDEEARHGTGARRPALEKPSTEKGFESVGPSAVRCRTSS